MEEKEEKTMKTVRERAMKGNRNEERKRKNKRK